MVPRSILSLHRFYRERNVITEEVKDVAKFMESLLGNECSGDNELAYLTLRVFHFPSHVQELFC